MSLIFISYRRSHHSYLAAMIARKLKKRFGNHRVFFDADSIPAGTNFRERIENNLRNCKVMLLLVHKEWIDEKGADGIRRLDNPDDYIQLEMELALKHNVQIVPVLSWDAKPFTREQLPDGLQSIADQQMIRVEAGYFLNESLNNLTLQLVRNMLSKVPRKVRIARGLVVGSLVAGFFTILLIMELILEEMGYGSSNLMIIVVVLILLALPFITLLVYFDRKDRFGRLFAKLV